MEIRKIQGIILCHILVAGLYGCSGSSGYRDDSSPWRAKHEAISANSDEFVEVGQDEFIEVNSMEEDSFTEESLNGSSVDEPEMVESEMVAEAEMEYISDFDAEPVPVEEMSAFERLEAMSNEPEPEPVEEITEIEAVEEEVEIDVADSSSPLDTDIMTAPSSAFAVQVYAGRLMVNVNRYINDHGLENMQVVKTNLDGDVINVVVSIHNGFGSAQQALAELEERTGSTPWIRSVSGLQNIAAQ